MTKVMVDRRYREENREKILEYKRRHYEENREKALEQKRRYYEENREKILEYHREYREANPEKLLDYQREWRAANPEKNREQTRRYREENREKLREQNRERRRRMGGAKPRRWLREMYGIAAARSGCAEPPCPWCGDPMKREWRGLVVDHVWAAARGGPTGSPDDGYRNLQVMHKGCNASKGVKCMCEAPWQDQRMIERISPQCPCNPEQWGSPAP